MVRAALKLSDAYEISELMFKIVDQMTRYFERAAAQSGLTEAHGRLMLELSEPVRMTTLAERLGCDASNVTGLVDRMQDRGLLRRRPDDRDRRVRWIELTDMGDALLREVQARIAADLPSVLALPRGDQVTLLRLLRRVHKVEAARLESVTTR